MLDFKEIAAKLAKYKTSFIQERTGLPYHVIRSIINRRNEFIRLSHFEIIAKFLEDEDNT